MTLKKIANHLFVFGNIDEEELYVSGSGTLILISYGKLFQTNSNEILDNFKNHRFFPNFKNFHCEIDDLENSILHDNMNGIKFEFNDNKLEYAKKICSVVEDDESKKNVMSLAVALCLYMKVEDDKIIFCLHTKDFIAKIVYYSLTTGEIHFYDEETYDIDEYVAELRFNYDNTIETFKVYDDEKNYYSFDSNMQLREYNRSY
jgi:hypothetical protein